MGRVSMPQGKGSQLHNRRDYEKIGKPIPDNVDVSRTPENITLVDKDIRQAYGEIFGKALAEYNDKQKRADRKIEDYCDHIKKSKNGEKLFYEDVVQWGSADDFKAPEMREKAKEALKQYAEGFQERNPNLKLIGAYIHMDEASPHLHLDYIPVATGYSRGLAIRNSLDRAMKQQGFEPENPSRKNNATKLWKENERAVFGQICRSFGLEVEPERKARGSLSVDEYKDARDAMLGEIAQEAQKASQELSEVQGKVNDLEKQLDAYKQPVADLREVDELLERGKKGITGKTAYKKQDNETIAAALKHGASADVQVKRLQDDLKQANSRLERKDYHIENLEKKLREERSKNIELQKEIDEMSAFKKFVFAVPNLYRQFTAWLEQYRAEQELKKAQELEKQQARGRSRSRTR